MSASTGGLRGLVHVRVILENINVLVILENINVLVIPDQLAISKAHEVFNDDGTLKDKKQEDQVKMIGSNVAKLLLKLSS